MQSKFLAAINQLCDEKNIPKDSVLEAIKAALKAAYRKDFGTKEQNVEVELDENSGVATVFLIKTVVKKIEDEEVEILEKDAKNFDKKAKVGSEIKIDVTPANYGRIAAQAAKQVIIQRLQEAEKDVMYDTFKDRENELVNAVVQRADGRNVYLNLDDKVTTNLPFEQQIRGEKYYAGQRLKLYLDRVIKTSKGPELLISRTHPNLVWKLLEREIPEIRSGLVVIKSIARDPGVRCKVAVHSDDPKIDPIGSCVGQKGVRVQNITDELSGERLDIIPWSDKIEEYIKKALEPAKTGVIEIFEKEKRAKVYVQPDQRPLAIGKRGQNVRLASILVGWEIDILDIGEFEGTQTKSSKVEIEKIEDLGIRPELVESLKEANLVEASQLKGLSAKDLAEVEGIDEDGAKEIAAVMKKVK